VYYLYCYLHLLYYDLPYCHLHLLYCYLLYCHLHMLHFDLLYYSHLLNCYVTVVLVLSRRSCLEPLTASGPAPDAAGHPPEPLSLIGSGAPDRPALHL